MEDSERLRKYLRTYEVLTEEEIEEFCGKVVRKRLKKGEYLFREGKVCREVVFVLSGVLRSFYYSSSLEEVTYCFSFEGAFITAYSSFITQQGTVENIKALTDVELFSVSREVVTELEAKSVNWLRLLKMIAEREYVKMEQRVFILQRESAEVRYRSLVEQHPEYLQLIPLNYLASYLGITQRHLSRIRSTSGSN